MADPLNPVRMPMSRRVKTEPMVLAAEAAVKPGLRLTARAAKAS